MFCDGTRVPNLINYIAKVWVLGSASLGEVLVPALIEAFVGKNQLSAILRLESEYQLVYLLRDAVTGKPRAELQFHLSTAEEGFADLIADKAEFALSTRQMRPVEQRHIEENKPKGVLSHRHHAGPFGLPHLSFSACGCVKR
ncbi:MAG: hypothetical protein OSA23_16765 [Rhodospirillales bacterium]|nr:hypothetical protein [Rhodospirillales bacterium]